MNAVDVRAWDQAARAGFTYEGDGVFDTWRSHAGAVLNGRRWSGDCDDLTSTVLDLLGRRSVPLDQRFRLLVDSSGGGKIDHMVGCVLTADRQFLIVGDTFGQAYGARSMPHRAIEYQRMDEWTPGGDAIWRAGAPWRVD